MCLHFHCLKGILCYNPNFKISKRTFTQQRILVIARVAPLSHLADMAGNRPAYLLQLETTGHISQLKEDQASTCFQI